MLRTRSSSNGVQSFPPQCNQYFLPLLPFTRRFLKNKQTKTRDGNSANEHKLFARSPAWNFIQVPQPFGVATKKSDDRRGIPVFWHDDDRYKIDHDLSETYCLLPSQEIRSRFIHGISGKQNSCLTFNFYFVEYFLTDNDHCRFILSGFTAKLTFIATFHFRMYYMESFPFYSRTLEFLPFLRSLFLVEKLSL